MSLCKEYRKHKIAYFKQRNSAKHRDIQWNFSYLQWWRKWCESGKWEQRGKKEKQYCMARYNDKGPYSYENTKIITNLENWEEHIATPETRKKMSINNTGQNNPFFGKKHNIKTRKKISQSGMGRKHSEESKQKMSKSHKARWER